MTFRRAETPILAAIFLDLLGFGMIIADIQLRAESMVPRGWPAGLIVGGLLASTFITQLIASPRWGAASDHLGRKPFVVACTAISAVAMLTYGLAGNLWVLLLSRTLSGFGAANVAVAQAYLSDLYEPADRTAALGRIGAAISTGLVIGPPLGGFLAASGGNLLIGSVAGGASMFGAVWMLLALPSPPPKEERKPGRAPVIDLRLLKDTPKLRPLVLIAVVAWLSLATLEGTFARLIEHLYKYDQREFGVIFGYESILSIAVQGLLLVWITKRFRPTLLLRIAYLTMGVGLALNPFAGFLMPAIAPFAILIVASTLYATGAGISNPTVNSLCSQLTPDSRQGELFGLLQGARSIGFVAGPLLGGCLFDWQPAAPYLLAGTVCVGAAILVPNLEVGQPE
jgi:MFS family permease